MHRTFVVTLIVAAAFGASPAVASGASRCEGAGPPTSGVAWRAYVPARTLMRPRPGGLFATQDSSRSPAGSFEGSWILTLTAHSQVLNHFDGGVALHGRGGASLGDPLGMAASHGCIRFDNGAIGEIVRRIGRTG